MTSTHKTVSFTIENTNFPKRANDKSGSGIGLKNLEKRLELLYPEQYLFQTEVISDRFIVNLEIETI